MQSFSFPDTWTIQFSLDNILSKVSDGGIYLGGVGLLVLADLSVIVQRTALTGSSSLFDIFVLAPGIIRQQKASGLNGGELPTTGAMNSGYVFRVENEGTVSFLQSIGRSGHLVNVGVVKRAQNGRFFLGLFEGGVTSGIFYVLTTLLTPASLIFLVIIHDFWAVCVLLVLMTARLINVVVIKQRTVKGWKGAKEPEKDGDLLILLSQDRWIRMKGLVDDLKEVTAGQWLREETLVEGFASALSTILVYISATLAFNASTTGSIVIASLLLSSAGLLGLCNAWTRNLRMFDCIVHQVGDPKKYARRLVMAEELIKEAKRDDWAIAMGLIVPPKGQAQRVSL